MKNKLIEIIDQYLDIFPEEGDRQKEIIKYLNKSKDPFDWDDFNGHVVAGGLIYAEKEKRFLMLEHRDLDLFLHPGGHVDKTDSSILEAAKREIIEETGLDNIKLFKIIDNEIVPLDIDTHKIEVNKRLNLPEHYHFEFRYLFKLDKIQEVNIDENESRSFKWIDISELEKDDNYKMIVEKIKTLNIV